MRILFKGMTAILIAISGLIGCGVIFFSILSIYKEFTVPKPKMSKPAADPAEIIYSTMTFCIGLFMVWYTPKLIRWGGDYFDRLYEQAKNFLQLINSMPKQQEEKILKLQQLDSENFQRRKIWNSDELH